MEKKNAMLDLLKKKNTTNLDLADNIAASVHQTAVAPAPPPQYIEPKEEPTKRISLNTPITTYIEVKALSVKRGTTLMQYILDLIDEDIKRNKK